MELFVNFCEDTIFEMQLAAQISASDRDEEVLGAEADGVDGKEEEDNDDTRPEQKGSALSVSMKRLLLAPFCGLMTIMCLLSIRNMKRQIKKVTVKGLILAIAVFLQKILSTVCHSIVRAVCSFLHVLYLVFLSGCLIEFAKQTKLSDLFSDLPDPTLDDVTGVTEGVVHKVKGTARTMTSRGDLQATTQDLSAVSRNPQLLTNIFGLQLRKEGGQYMLISQDSDVSEAVNPSEYQVRSGQARTVQYNTVHMHRLQYYLHERS